MSTPIVTHSGTRTVTDAATDAATNTAIRPATVVVHNLSKRYGDTPVLSEVSLSVAAGEFLAIVGESGSGKSTLLNCMAGLDSWDSGSVTLDGVDLNTQSDDQRALLRREKVGFVFQAFHVLPHLDVAQNVGLPLMLLRNQRREGTPTDAQNLPDWRDAKQIDQRVQSMLAAVGLAGLGTRLPQTLSGGQLQRVAIARALVHQPKLLLADEPTGNLDAKTATVVMDALIAQTRAHGTALVLVTHSESATARADRVINLISNS